MKDNSSICAAKASAVSFLRYQGDRWQTCQFLDSLFSSPTCSIQLFSETIDLFPLPKNTITHSSLPFTKATSPLVTAQHFLFCLRRIPPHDETIRTHPSLLPRRRLSFFSINAFFRHDARRCCCTISGWCATATAGGERNIGQSGIPGESQFCGV